MTRFWPLIAGLVLLAIWFLVTTGPAIDPVTTDEKAQTR